MNLIIPMPVNEIEILEHPELRIDIGLTYDLEGKYFLSNIFLIAVNYNNIEVKELYRRFNKDLKEDSRIIIIKSNNNESFIVINNYYLANIEGNSIAINNTPFKIKAYIYNKKDNIEQNNKSKIILEP